ncbi:hypothetical protein ACJIZ3_025092 [Penstemon smallii]|uniref:BZIP domain-containing protein n=1 Tax=Penstemon smallii TaxID=265156 RepID=A0ABD3TTS6_9LAMI
MMMSTKNPILYQTPPVHEHLDNFTPTEINEIFSLLQSKPISVNSTSSSITTESNKSIEEQKCRRMISNRESARRSRFRKKRHLEKLTSEVNRFKLENRELKNRIAMLTRECYMIQRESNRLLSESIYLQQKLAGLQHVLSFMELY